MKWHKLDVVIQFLIFTYENCAEIEENFSRLDSYYVEIAHQKIYINFGAIFLSKHNELYYNI